MNVSIDDGDADIGDLRNSLLEECGTPAKISKVVEITFTYQSREDDGVTFVTRPLNVRSSKRLNDHCSVVLTEEAPQNCRILGDDGIGDRETKLLGGSKLFQLPRCQRVCSGEIQPPHPGNVCEKPF